MQPKTLIETMRAKRGVLLVNCMAGETPLEAFIDVAAPLYDVEVFKCEVDGFTELHAHKVGSTSPAGFKVRLLDPSEILSNQSKLNDIFQLLVDNVHAYKGTGTQGDWRPLPTH